MEESNTNTLECKVCDNTEIVMISGDAGWYCFDCRSVSIHDDE